MTVNVKLILCPKSQQHISVERWEDWLFCLLWSRDGMWGKQMCQCGSPLLCRAAFCITFGYKTYAFKYLHLCPTLLTKFNSTHFKNLQYSICFIAIVRCWAVSSDRYIIMSQSRQVESRICPTKRSRPQNPGQTEPSSVNNSITMLSAESRKEIIVYELQIA